MALLLATYALISGPALAADSTETKAKQIWQLLDYVAVDYGGAVANGTVLKASEYAEMQEFVATAERQLGELPSKTDKARLLQQATELRRAVANKADPAIVAQLAHALSSAVQKAYPFPVAPAAVPDLARGAQLFQAQCAACHGMDGKGNQALGAPNLTDDIWLHGWGENAIIAMINNGKTNEMPAQEGKLTDAQINVLTAYVWGLSNKPGAAR